MRLAKLSRFGWRTARNFLSFIAPTRKLLFPRVKLASNFGRGDADYAISVFRLHYDQLSAAGFYSGYTVLEVGPGRNLGTALLMWALNYSRCHSEVTIVLWDVYPNMTVDLDSFRKAARMLLDSAGLQALLKVIPDVRIDNVLGRVASGELKPDIFYHVASLNEFSKITKVKDFSLVYSQAAIEHIWDIEDFWQKIISLTIPGGWHSHRIDLADHGRRYSNYIEMLEWSPLSYWLTMRFIPGAINRCRASQHTALIEKAGLDILSEVREVRDTLPIPLCRIHRSFRSLSESDLKTTGLDLVARRSSQ